MLNQDEFHAILAEAKTFLDSYMSEPKGSDLKNFYDLAVKITQAAIHTVPDRMVGDEQFDSRMLLFRVAEALVESSFLLDMGTLSGVSTALATPDACSILARKKLEQVYHPNSFVGNEYTEDTYFPNLFHGLDYSIEFFEIAPTLDYAKVPKEVMAWALAGDVTKVTCMVLWTSTLALDSGFPVSDSHRILKLIYTLKYGIVMSDYTDEQIKEICDEVSPWLRNLKEVTVGGRTPDSRLN